MMSKFVCMDWDLQAIVRGYNSTSGEMISAASTAVMENPVVPAAAAASACFAPLSLQQDGLFGFPDICDTTTVLDELEDLYKPFYPQTTILTSTPISVPCSSTTQVAKKPKKVVVRKEKPVDDLCGSAGGNSDTDHHHHDEAKPKKGRKNQQKRVVVQQDTADGLSSDLWAWRKYGQKPIKGSPYPRSYYRCSSSKGCLARKQVERSRSDPGIFIVTYSAEHNHAHPTRRSSLAGSTRNKSPVLQSGPPAAIDLAAPLLHEHRESTVNVSTTTPDHDLVTSIEEETTIQEDMIKKEKEDQVFEEEENEIVMPDIIFSDDLFPSLEDLEGLLLDPFPSNFDFSS